ncbi:MAG: hypothetical protein ACEY3D_04345 [Rickettsia sp.]
MSPRGLTTGSIKTIKKDWIPLQARGMTITRAILLVIPLSFN